MFRRSLVLFTLLLAGPPLAAQSDDNIIRLKLQPAVRTIARTQIPASA